MVGCTGPRPSTYNPPEICCDSELQGTANLRWDVRNSDGTLDEHDKRKT